MRTGSNALAQLALVATPAQSCEGLTETRLTSVGCPERCSANPCVLYGPDKKERCQETATSGACFTEAVDSNGTCSVTYQCMNVGVGETNPWSRILSAAPTSVESVIVADVDLQSALASVDFSTQNWTRVTFTNVNLTEVPTGLSKMALEYVDLSNNAISSIPDAAPFENVTILILAFNRLNDLTIALPSIVSLNLTGNPLTTIPESVYTMKMLKSLTLRQSNLTDVPLTEVQFAFLQRLQTLDTDLVTTTCPSGSLFRKFTNGSSSVCVTGLDTSTTGSGESSSTSTGMTVGIILGAVVAAVLLAWCLHSKCKRATTKRADTTMAATDAGYLPCSVWNDPDLLEVRIEYRDIELLELVSRGDLGEVWLGLYMNEKVAVKRLLGEQKKMNLALTFGAEIKTMARLDHPKITRFIGVAWTSALSIQAVTEFMDCGDLRSLLDSSQAPSLTWANLKCQIAIDIADALVYMHTLNPKLIHRDLKSRNVLIDANSGAKVSCFGVSHNRPIEEIASLGDNWAGWIAPEIIRGDADTDAADIYSFGVVLTELDTTKLPYHDAVNPNGAPMGSALIAVRVAKAQLRPSLSSECPVEIAELATRCLSNDPSQRPRADQIVYQLRAMLKDM